MKADEDLQNVGRVGLPLAPAFNWSVGNWMEQFFDGLKERKIMASKCGLCGRVFLPPRMICERCFAKTEEWVEIPETGTVEAFTAAHVRVGPDGELADLPEPQLIALVKHDEADTLLVAGLVAKNASAGMRVRVVWNETPSGALDAISCYEPMD
jgi:hypothetical protein